MLQNTPVAQRQSLFTRKSFNSAYMLMTTVRGYLKMNAQKFLAASLEAVMPHVEPVLVLGSQLQWNMQK